MRACGWVWVGVCVREHEFTDQDIHYQQCSWQDKEKREDESKTQ